MKIRVPSNLSRNAPLIIVLHGCLQTPESFDAASGFSKYADRRGFVLVYPEQTQANNANLCFNWFRPSAVARDRAELMSIRQMIETTLATHHLDRSRVYLAGLSAGGAMALALAATYPEMFAGVAVFAGLPFGAARDTMSALSVMKSGSKKPADELGDLVRRASPGGVKWPAVAVWQGTDDRTFNPPNADSIVTQWLNVIGLEGTISIDRSMPWDELRRWHSGGQDQVVYYRLEVLLTACPSRHAAEKQAAIASSYLRPFLPPEN